ncbi:MAG TPA: alpha/beta hydrolase [Acidimicrobiales bacterium]|nr:alpha/beta hydrolase [Acidimicrobiales bacterium]
MTTTRRVELAGRGIGLAVLEAGAGGRPLLVLHGFAAAKEDWADGLDDIASRGWHVVVPDQRGCGTSDHPDGLESYSMAIVADDALALADALGWERFVLLGQSQGGMVAQLVALAAPERLDALVLVGTSARKPDGVDPQMVATGQQVVADGGLELLIELQAKTDDPLSTPAHRRLLAERPGYAEYGAAKLRACSPEMWRSMLGDMVDQPDRTEALRTLAVPTLVAVGALDHMFLADSEALAATIPAAHLAVIEEAGHSVQLENPERWQATLFEFLTPPTRRATSGCDGES